MAGERKVFYKSKDGTKLCGIYSIPEKIKGFVLLAHGINVDKNEWGNFFGDIAHELYLKGFGSLRFDFRGHGESGGEQKEMTVIGETIDLEASIKAISKYWRKNIAIIGMSFGAGPAILYAAQESTKINCLVLLCPVIDYISTFLKPVVPWAKDTFNKDGFKQLDDKGFLLLDDDFAIGAKLVQEFKVIKPFESLKTLKLPVLLMHGNKDSMVPYKVSEKYGQVNNLSEFLAIRNAEHGFADKNDDAGTSKKSIKNKQLVIQETIAWIEKWCRR